VPGTRISTRKLKAENGSLTVYSTSSRS
jgi:hypothetical protein